MTQSEQINELATALAKAQGELKGALKDSRNPFFNSKYADLASVWEACREPFAKHGLSIIQFPNTEFADAGEIYEWTAKSGEKRVSVRVLTTVSVVTRLCHASGQWIEDRVSARLASGDPQAVGSAITYLRRYSLQSVAGVAPEDDDGEAASKPNSQQKAKLTMMQASELVPAPTGYAAWVATLEGVAEEGTDALKKAWNKSKPEYRAHLTRTDMATWERLKEQAGEIDLRRVEANA